MNNKSKINTSKGKVYLTIVAFASLLMMAFNVNTNSMNVNAFDLGLISKDNNLGSIDTDSLFNCFGAAITCDNDNTVNNNISVNNGTNGGNGETPIDPDTPLPPVELTDCSECISALGPDVLVDLRAALDLSPTATPVDICFTLDALGTVGAVIAALNGEVSVDVIVEVLACLGVEITVGQVLGIIAGL